MCNIMPTFSRRKQELDKGLHDAANQSKTLTGFL